MLPLKTLGDLTVKIFTLTHIWSEDALFWEIWAEKKITPNFHCLLKTLTWFCALVHRVPLTLGIGKIPYYIKLARAVHIPLTFLCVSNAFACIGNLSCVFGANSPGVFSFILFYSSNPSYRTVAVPQRQPYQWSRVAPHIFLSAYYSSRCEPILMKINFVFCFVFSCFFFSVIFVCLIFVFYLSRLEFISLGPVSDEIKRIWENLMSASSLFPFITRSLFKHIDQMNRSGIITNNADQWLREFVSTSPYCDLWLWSASIGRRILEPIGDASQRVVWKYRQNV